jgi:hypothetical protein
MQSIIKRKGFVFTIEKPIVSAQTTNICLCWWPGAVPRPHSLAKVLLLKAARHCRKSIASPQSQHNLFQKHNRRYGDRLYTPPPLRARSATEMASPRTCTPNPALRVTIAKLPMLTHPALQTAVISVFNSVQAYSTLALTSRVYNPSSIDPPPKVPKHVTGLSSRTFGTWTFLAAVIRLYAAYNITDPLM